MQNRDIRDFKREDVLSVRQSFFFHTTFTGNNLKQEDLTPLARVYTLCNEHVADETGDNGRYV